MTQHGIDDILARYTPAENALIEVLQDIQARFHYLPEALLHQVATYLNVPLARIYSVATFYKAFRLEPRGENYIKVCTGTACHVRGAQLLLGEIETKCGAQPGQTSADGKYTIDAVNCVGACAMAPVVIINDRYYGNLNPGKMKKIFEGSSPDEN